MNRRVWIIDLLLISSCTLLFAGESPPLPKAVTSFGAAVCDGAIYVYGGHMGKAHGYSKETVSGAMWRMDLKSRREWEVLPGNVPVQSPGIAAWKGKVILAGGMQPQNEPGEDQKLKSLDVAAMFDPATKTWTQLPPLPQPRSSHALVVMDDQLYAVGGWPLDVGSPKPASEGSKSKEWHDTMAVLDLKNPDAGWKTQPQPWTRRALAAVAFGGKLWCIGGMTDDNELSSAVDVYEPSTGKWSSVPPVGETERAKAFGCAACVMGDRLYVSPEGGKVYCIRTNAEAWAECAKLAKPRYFHQLIALDDAHLMAIGGTSKGLPMDDVEIVTIEHFKTQP